MRQSVIEGSNLIDEEKYIKDFKQRLFVSILIKGLEIKASSMNQYSVANNPY